MGPLQVLFWAFGLAVFVLGIQGALYFPLTLVYEVWKRRTLRRLPPFRGRVSVVVPAYNEERTLRAAVETLLESPYPDLEVIAVDDRALDATPDPPRELDASHPVPVLR